MLLFSTDSGIVFSVTLANVDGDYIKDKEKDNFPETTTAYNNECFSATDQMIDDLISRWAKKCSDKNSDLPKGAELSCSAYVQAEGMDAPVWVVVMPTV